MVERRPKLSIAFFITGILKRYYYLSGCKDSIKNIIFGSPKNK